jgi:hypothetical protein
VTAIASCVDFPADNQKLVQVRGKLRLDRSIVSTSIPGSLIGFTDWAHGEAARRPNSGTTQSRGAPATGEQDDCPRFGWFKTRSHVTVSYND